MPPKERDLPSPGLLNLRMPSRSASQRMSKRGPAKDESPPDLTKDATLTQRLFTPSALPKPRDLASPAPWAAHHDGRAFRKLIRRRPPPKHTPAGAATLPQSVLDCASPLALSFAHPAPSAMERGRPACRFTRLAGNRSPIPTAPCQAPRSSHLGSRSSAGRRTQNARRVRSLPIPQRAQPLLRPSSSPPITPRCGPSTRRSCLSAQARTSPRSSWAGR